MTKCWYVFFVWWVICGKLLDVHLQLNSCDTRCSVAVKGKNYFVCQNKYFKNISSSLQQYCDAVTHELFVHRHDLMWAKITSENRTKKWEAMFTKYVDNTKVQRTNYLLRVKKLLSFKFHINQVCSALCLWARTDLLLIEIALEYVVCPPLAQEFGVWVNTNNSNFLSRLERNRNVWIVKVNL